MVQEMRSGHARLAGRIQTRLAFTLIGAAALVVGAFLDWTRSLAGNKLTLRSLVQNDFYTRSNMLHTVAAISVLIAIVAVLSLLDPSGWLTRLAGLAGLVLFVMFAIQVYRHDGQNFRPAVDALQPGAWLQLGGGVVLLAGGLVRYRRRRGRVAPVTDDTVAKEAPESASATSPTAVKSPDADVERAAPDPDSERERLEPETTVFRPPAPSEISVGAKGGDGRGSEESGGA
ncbi:hypothetical protein [Actinospica sp.]|jgi:hypothetical protein|uniref:hypothetical protein n=1 Tax=Actinospica sp. TaxID=1872142 RepID=UPI002C724C10|nr:hypothetical protein [Actinospica sp.]HWG25121.1 hypothetical protein [Actinospica sp.]